MSYAQDAIEAAATLAEDGQVVTLRRVTPGTYDPATGAVSNTTSDVSRYGVVFDYSDGLSNMAGTIIQQGDKRLLMEAGTIPDMNDVVLVGGVQYGIAGIKEVNPAGTVVLYDIQLRLG